MKFSDYFFEPGVKFTAAVFGILTGIIVWCFSGNLQYALLVGALLALITSITDPIKHYLSDRPYEKIKKTMQQPFLIDRRVRFTVRGGTVGGFFLLTEEKLVFLSLERGTHRLELAREDVKRIALDHETVLSVFMTDQKFVRVISADCENFYQILTQNGWLND